MISNGAKRLSGHATIVARLGASVKNDTARTQDLSQRTWSSLGSLRPCRLVAIDGVGAPCGRPLADALNARDVAGGVVGSLPIGRVLSATQSSRCPAPCRRTRCPSSLSDCTSCEPAPAACRHGWFSAKAQVSRGGPVRMNAQAVGASSPFAGSDLGRPQPAKCLCTLAALDRRVGRQRRIRSRDCSVADVGAGERLTPLRRLRFDPPGWWRRRPG